MSFTAGSVHAGAKQQCYADFRASYHADVLRLPIEGTEEESDIQLMTEAKELGVDIDLSPSLGPFSNPTDASVPDRRSMSVYSMTSESTGLTSNYSDPSRDPSQGHGRRRSRASLSLRDYDMFLARGTTDSTRTSMSFSRPTTPAQSSFSLPLSSPEPTSKRGSRVLKGLSMLRFHRPESSGAMVNGCPHCPPHTSSQRRAMHGVPCGHRLCTQALRSTIKSALANASGAIPSCCGVPIPGELVQSVATSEEQDELLQRLEQWDEAISLAPLRRSELKELASSERASNDGPNKSNESRQASNGPVEESNIKQPHEHPEFKQLEEQHGELHDRFTAWIEQRRVELHERHERMRREMNEQHESAEDDMLERHGRSMGEAEDRQVKAEADLREQHEQEQRDNATALRHLEAFCAGTYSTGETHGRVVTEQARAELERLRKARDSMDAKHASAINVLRGEQARRMRLRQARQEKELQDLLRAQRKEELEMDRACTAESRGLEEFVAEKQKRIAARWRMENAVLAKRMRLENGRAWSLELAMHALPDGHHDGGEEGKGREIDAT
ncbi:hypothetical protein BDY17DRAFT_307670 [Neohortaea acidophila]|uniref:Uncharacterized protein n=1 Tax=Neohortaea acidophila TaxID=245834 RepID=A0A6A6Q385_9PEZI|nr:uncharacterized protein BDY17DRAFT_307670 [Neohortaea acidophila]KAF2486113.1 hypothetical protein BDY17DRAFT_307670 [Neohortaea acidophila]